jgi:HlyD family secretion protein
MQERRFEIRSDEVQEILSHIPHWIIRWGITVIFVTILMLLIVAWVVKYPAIITTRVTITTQNPPANIVSQSSGKIIKLFVKENEFVKRDAYLAVIENPANIEDIFKLKKQLETFRILLEKPNIDTSTVLEYSKDLGKRYEFVDFDLNRNLVLGELQSNYSEFLQNYLDYKFFIQTNYYANKIKSIKTQFDYYRDLNSKLIRQKEIISKEVELAQKKYNNDKTLFEKELISEVDLANTESAYLGKKLSLENIETNIINNNVQLSEYEKTIMDLNYQFYERNIELVLSVQESYKKLQSQIAIWEQRYVLKAPIDGYVSFFKFWSSNQFVNAGDEVMAVVPTSQDIVGKVYLTGFGAGKIKSGQKVKIKFDNYPFNEFGIVEGKVESISLVARDNTYSINVSLPNGLITNYNKTLEFKQGMQGVADIITEDLRLIERIFNQFRYILTTAVGK